MKPVCPCATPAAGGGLLFDNEQGSNGYDHSAAAARTN